MMVSGAVTWSYCYKLIHQIWYVINFNSFRDLLITQQLRLYIETKMKTAASLKLYYVNLLIN